MKYLLFFLTLPAIASVQVGDCINVPSAKSTDLGAFQVDEVMETMYLATSLYHQDVQKLLRKASYAKVACPSQEHVDKIIAMGRKIKEENDQRKRDALDLQIKQAEAYIKAKEYEKAQIK